MKRFDVNACFGHWPHWPIPHTTGDDLVALMDRNRIDRAACISLRGLFIDWRVGNKETLAVAAGHPDRLVPMATVSPFPDGHCDELRKAIVAGARGIRLYPAFHNYRLDHPFVDEVCTVAAECGVPVMIPTRLMMNWRFQALPIETIAVVVARHVGVTFILSGPNYLVEYQALVQLMRGCDNTVYEISCLQSFDGVGQLVAEVGARRVLFGTGAVLNNPACNVAKLDHASVSDNDRIAIAGENAERLLNC